MLQIYLSKYFRKILKKQFSLQSMIKKMHLSMQNQCLGSGSIGLLGSGSIGSQDFGFLEPDPDPRGQISTKNCKKNFFILQPKSELLKTRKILNISFDFIFVFKNGEYFFYISGGPIFLTAGQLKCNHFSLIYTTGQTCTLYSVQSSRNFDTHTSKVVCLCIILSEDRTATEFLLEGLVRLRIYNPG